MSRLICASGLFAFLTLCGGFGCATQAVKHETPPARVSAPVAHKEFTARMPQPQRVPPKPPMAEPSPTTVEPTPVVPNAGEVAEQDAPWSDYLGSSRMQIAAIQTLIDREHFSPGVIDGIWGPKTETALRAWQQRHNLVPTGIPDGPTFQTLGSLRRAFRTYMVTDDDHRDLAPVPSTWVGKARAERLNYETVEEKLAEQFHCSRAFLRHLNPTAGWPNPPTGTQLTVPEPKPKPLPDAVGIEISLSEKTVCVRDANNAVVALFPCSIGRDKNKRPRGELHVVAWAHNPNYYFDPAVFPEDPEARLLTQKLIIPPGPNNPVGTAWISLSLPGYGIHGTPHPEDIGKTESHGCFRLANWNAEKLIRMVRPQMPVLIRD